MFFEVYINSLFDNVSREVAFGSVQIKISFLFTLDFHIVFVCVELKKRCRINSLLANVALVAAEC